jgi:predicted Zn-dependent peptidase
MIKKAKMYFNEKVHILKLKNGMQVHILPKEDPYYTTYVELSIPYGSIDITYKKDNLVTKTPYGVAHFLEHKIFAMPNGDAFFEFSRLGADANAMTSYNQTSYLFVSTNEVMASLSHLMNMLDTPYFTVENVEQEKSIIAEELKMYFDDPNVLMQNKLMENMYKNHPIRYDIGGSLESILEITPEILMDIYKSFYNPSNRLITIAGKVDIDQIEAFFKDYETKNIEKHKKPKVLFPKESLSVLKRYEVEKKDISIDKILIGIKLKPEKLDPRSQIKKEMAYTMMLNMVLGQSSSNYENLLSNKLINQNYYIHVSFEKLAENIVIYAESKKVYKLKQILVNLLINDLDSHLTNESFERYKKVYLGQFIYALNHLETKAYLYGKYFHMNSSLFEVVEILKEINYQDIKNTIGSIQKKNMSILINKKA